MSFFNNVFGAGKTGKATKNAGFANLGILDNTRREGLDTIGQFAGQARDALGRSGDQFQSIFDLGKQGAGLYADALGINGAGGSARARSAFQTNPGYDFQMEQGLDALERRASSQGRVASGQTSLDTLRFSQGLADQSYGDWLSRLGGLGSMMTTGASGGMGVNQSLANLALGQGDRTLGLNTDVASGQMAANNQIAGAFEQRAAAERQGAGKLFDLGMNVAGTALGGGIPMQGLGYGGGMKRPVQGGLF